MSSPTVGGYPHSAAVPVRRQNKVLRRHWLTAALVLGMAGLAVYMGTLFYQTEVRLRQARAQHAEVEAKLADARKVNERLQVQVNKATEDGSMELMAKSMGFVYPKETVYQTNSAPGR